MTVRKSGRALLRLPNYQAIRLLYRKRGYSQDRSSPKLRSLLLAQGASAGWW
jgi:hypothetical protein